MKIWVLALVAVTASTGYTFARETTSSSRNLPTFSLLPAAKCEQATDARLCSVASPKEWSTTERLILEDTMRRLGANELVRGILVKAQENGYIGLRRYATDTKPDATYGRVPKISPGFVLYGAKEIGITDAFFAAVDMTDPMSGYRFGDLIVLHELVHAFDDRKTSIDAGFTSITGWTFRNNRWEYSHPVSVSGYNGVFAETVTLYGRGRYTEAWTRDRSFATSLAFPLPTIQSLATPGESFADILAHLIVDQRAATYLKPDVVAWFEGHVFPVLIDNARRFTTE